MSSIYPAACLYLQRLADRGSQGGLGGRGMKMDDFVLCRLQQVGFFVCLFFLSSYDRSVPPVIKKKERKKTRTFRNGGSFS